MYFLYLLSRVELIAEVSSFTFPLDDFNTLCLYLQKFIHYLGLFNAEEMIDFSLIFTLFQLFFLLLFLDSLVICFCKLCTRISCVRCFSTVFALKLSLPSFSLFVERFVFLLKWKIIKFSLNTHRKLVIQDGDLTKTQKSHIIIYSSCFCLSSFPFTNSALQQTSKDFSTFFLCSQSLHL